MENIEKKQLEDLSDNARVMVTQVSVMCDGGNLGMIYNLDATIQEIAEAMEYIIDQGWIGNRWKPIYKDGEEEPVLEPRYVYARLCSYTNDDRGRNESGVIFVTDPNEFNDWSEPGYCAFSDDDPIIVGIADEPNFKTVKDASGVYAMTNEQCYIPISVWVDAQGDTK